MAKPRIYTTSAIVLKYRNYSESDRFVTLLSRKMGRIEGFAKGVRRSTSKLTGHLELFYTVRITLAMGKNTDVITEVQILSAPDRINQNLNTVSCALNIIELALNVSTEGTGNELIYDLLEKTLNKLNTTHASNSAKLLAYYQLKLLSISGLSPEFKTCVECGNILDVQDHLYSAHTGGIVCPSCAPKQAGPLLNLSVNTIKVLRFLDAEDMTKIENFSVPKEILTKTIETLDTHIDYHIDRKTRSRSFFKAFQ